MLLETGPLTNGNMYVPSSPGGRAKVTVARLLELEALTVASERELPIIAAASKAPTANLTFINLTPR
jgi:hypothetical protein